MCIARNRSWLKRLNKLRFRLELWLLDSPWIADRLSTQGDPSWLVINSFVSVEREVDRYNPERYGRKIIRVTYRDEVLLRVAIAQIETPKNLKSFLHVYFLGYCNLIVKRDF